MIIAFGSLALAGTKAFAAFESQLGVVSTMLDENALGLEKYQEYLDRYGEGLRQLSTDMGEDTRTLSKGLYDILSASVAPEKAMSVLETSAKAAKAGITDTATSVDFITSALNAYGMEADKAGQVSDIAFATVASGKLTFQELASTIGEVAPTANMAGVSLEALGAMMATTTKSGIKAAESSTAINQFMLAFIKAGPKAASTWDELAKGTELQGQAWGAALLKGGNLAKTLGVLKGANESQLTTIFNNVRALKAANVLAKQADDYRANLARTTNSLGETERAYNKVSGDLSDQWSKVKKIATDLVTTIGQGLAPAIKKVTGGVIEWYKSNGKLLKIDILIWVNRLTGGLAKIKNLLTLGGSGSGSSTYSDLEKTLGDLEKAKSALNTAKGLREHFQDVADNGNRIAAYFANKDVTAYSSEVKTLGAELNLVNQKLDVLYNKLAKVQDSWQAKVARETEAFSQALNAWINSSAVTGATDSWQTKAQLFAKTMAADKAALAELAKLRQTEYQKDIANLNARLAKLRAQGTSEILIAQRRALELAKINAKQAEQEEAARKKELSAWQTQNKAIIAQAEQRRKAWDLLHGNIKEGAKAAAETERKLDEKALADKKTYLRMVADLSGDTNAQRLVQYQEFVEQVDKLQIDQYEKEEILALKRADLNKSTFERVLDSWADTTANMQTLTEESLKGIKGIFQSFFDDLFDDFKISWSSLLDVVKGTASNLLSQTATSWTTTAFANGAKWVMNQFSGTAQAATTGSPDSGFSFTSMLGGGAKFSDLFSGGSTSWMLADGGAISEQIAMGLTPDMGLFGQGGWAGTGLSGAGAAVTGVGGALTGWQLAQSLYGNGTGTQIGGAIGGGGGAIAGAAIGSIIAPGIGTVIGGALGGMLGGAGGGGIGSLFDGGDDTAEREADARAYTEAMTTLLDAAYLRRVQSGQESFDTAAYLQAQKRAHESDNRVGWDTLEADNANLKASGVLPWWMPDVSRANALRGTDAYTDQDLLKRDTLAGMLGQAFTGNSAIGWGLEDPFANFSVETINTLGESLATIQSGAETFGVTLSDLFENISAADIASGEWANILANELAPAQLMSRMEDKLRADGLSELEIAQQKVAAIIDTLLGTFDMSEENQAAWVEQLLNATATQADLAAKTQEYSEIVQKLQSAHELDDESLNALIARGRDLRKELGLGESAFSGVETAMKNMQSALTDQVTPALVDLVEQLKAALADAEGGEETQKNHTGGLIRNHTGGLIQAALAAGLISASGGRMHTGGGASGLAYDEVMRILQLGEFVIRRDSVTPLTRPFLEDLNNRGDAALASYVPLISPEEGPARASASGGGIVINIGSIVVPNESGDEADARAYGEAFAEEFADRVMVRLKDASGAGQGVIHEAGIISRRFGHAS